MAKTKIKPGKFIAAGSCGEVYEVEGNPNLVIKVPVGYVKREGKSTPSRIWGIKGTKQEIIDEMKRYKKLKLSKENAFLPSKAVKLDRSNVTAKPLVGIVRPKVNTAVSKITYAQVEQLRRKIIALSRKGIILSDGVQAGIDSKGSAVIYDAGFVKQGDPEDAFDINQCKWERFITKTGKIAEKCGKISP